MNEASHHPWIWRQWSWYGGEDDENDDEVDADTEDDGEDEGCLTLAGA